MATSFTDWESRLADLSKLKYGWFGNGSPGAPMTEQALAGARVVVQAAVAGGFRVPGIFPTPVGGVNLEWRPTSGITEVEVLPDGRFELCGTGSRRATQISGITGDITRVIGFLREAFDR